MQSEPAKINDPTDESVSAQARPPLRPVIFVAESHDDEIPIEYLHAKLAGLRELGYDTVLLEGFDTSTPFEKIFSVHEGEAPPRANRIAQRKEALKENYDDMRTDVKRITKAWQSADLDLSQQELNERVREVRCDDRDLSLYEFEKSALILGFNIQGGDVENEFVLNVLNGVQSVDPDEAEEFFLSNPLFRFRNEYIAEKLFLRYLSGESIIINFGMAHAYDVKKVFNRHGYGGEVLYYYPKGEHFLKSQAEMHAFESEKLRNPTFEIASFKRETLHSDDKQFFERIQAKISVPTDEQSVKREADRLLALARVEALEVVHASVVQQLKEKEALGVSHLPGAADAELSSVLNQLRINFSSGVTRPAIYIGFHEMSASVLESLKLKFTALSKLGYKTITMAYAGKFFPEKDILSVLAKDVEEAKAPYFENLRSILGEDFESTHDMNTQAGLMDFLKDWVVGKSEKCTLVLESLHVIAAYFQAIRKYEFVDMLYDFGYRIEVLNLSKAQCVDALSQKFGVEMSTFPDRFLNESLEFYQTQLHINNLESQCLDGNSMIYVVDDMCLARRVKHVFRRHPNDLLCHLTIELSCHIVKPDLGEQNKLQRLKTTFSVSDDEFTRVDGDPDAREIKTDLNRFLYCVRSRSRTVALEFLGATDDRFSEPAPRSAVLLSRAKPVSSEIQTVTMGTKARCATP